VPKVVQEPANRHQVPVGPRVPYAEIQVAYPRLSRGNSPVDLAVVGADLEVPGISVASYAPLLLGMALQMIFQKQRLAVQDVHIVRDRFDQVVERLEQVVQPRIGVFGGQKPVPVPMGMGYNVDRGHTIPCQRT
jgi:hypothetical protein